MTNYYNHVNTESLHKLTGNCTMLLVTSQDFAAFNSAKHARA